jgi:hypothetical protein
MAFQELKIKEPGQINIHLLALSVHELGVKNMQN